MNSADIKFENHVRSTQMKHFHDFCRNNHISLPVFVLEYIKYLETEITKLQPKAQG
jgi:vacuolar-type H+-ATPase subunit C/Vma6